MSDLNEKVVLASLLRDSSLFEKAYPFMEDRLFESKWSKCIWRTISRHWEKYKSLPSDEALRLRISKISSISQKVHDECVNFADWAAQTEGIDPRFGADETEEWIKSRKYYCSVLDAAEAYEKGILDPMLPEKISDTLSFSFDTDVGLEFSDPGQRWRLYSSEDAKTKTGLAWMDEITGGGIPPKTLNMFISSSSGGGKTLTMCFLAGELLKSGMNVLYVTAEMAADRIMQRIDANLLDIPLSAFQKLSETEFMDKAGNVASRTSGRLFVHEYPTASAHVGNIRHLLRELRLKKGFIPDVMFIDYINIFTSFRHPKGENSYTTVKSTCEEFRGLMVETGCIGFSATQGNRSAMESEDVSQKSVSESVGVNFTADLIIGIISTPQFDEQGVYMFKQVKNRYGDTSYRTRQLIGVDKPRMRLFQVSDSPGDMNSDIVPIKLKKRGEA